MLKYQIDSLDGVEESQQGLYKEQDDGTFVLQAEGLPDVAGLKASRDKLLEEKKKEKEKREAAEEAAKAARLETAKKKGDYEALSKQLQEENTQLKDSLAQRDESDADREINLAASQIAGRLADGFNADNLAALIKPRLRWEDGKVKVTDSDGNLTISSLEDFEKEVEGAEQYSALVTGSKAAGGGASGSTKGSGAPASGGGDLVGDKPQRVAAVKKMFPDLK